MKDPRYSIKSLCLPLEILYLFASALIFIFLLGFVRLLPEKSFLTGFWARSSIENCWEKMGFVSHDLRHPVLNKIVVFGNEDSLLKSYLPASIISAVDPAVSSLYGSKYSGLSLAIGRQPLRIQSDWLRIWLFNFRIIDSTVIPASKLSHVFALRQKYIAIYGLCSDDCDFSYGTSESSSIGSNRYIWTTPDAFLKYLKNFYPIASTGYVDKCDQ